MHIWRQNPLVELVEAKRAQYRVRNAKVPQEQANHHHAYELYAAIVVSLIATILKFGDRSHMGAVLLATSLVADLQLIMAALVWAIAIHVQGLTDAQIMPSVVSLAGGALLANLASGVLLIIETAALRR